jgi:hypothetical protein
MVGTILTEFGIEQGRPRPKRQRCSRYTAGEVMKLRKYCGPLAILAVCLIPLTGSRAQTPPDASVAPEIAQIYSSFCLEKFPDTSAVGALASARKATAISQDQVKRFLHSDPGNGWVLHAGTGDYIVLLEAPPFRTCSVRRMTPSGVNDVKPYIAAVNSYIAGKNGKLVGIPPSHNKTPDNIADISTYGYGMMDGSGKAVETFAVILTNYHGHAPADQQAAAAGGVGVEVRMVHQILPAG